MPAVVLGAYSVLYQRNDDPGILYAVDWDWGAHRRWSSSEKDNGGIRWDPIGTFDRNAYEALLKHFGFENWAEEFPPEKVVTMRPKELAAERRKKERESCLPRLEMISNTIGAHVSAEEYP